MAAPITNAISVRSDDWAAIVKFINAQDVVVNAAVPRHLFQLQAHAREQLMALKPTLDKYKLAEDMVEVTVELDNGQQQKTSVSQKALSSENKTGDASSGNSTKTEKPTKVKDNKADSKVAGDTRSGQAGQQAKTATQKEEVKPAKPAKDKPSMFEDLLKYAKAPAVKPKGPTPVDVARAREPKLAARKAPKDANAPEPRKACAATTTTGPPAAKLGTSGSRVGKESLVRPDTNGRTALEDKTNKGKSAPGSRSKPSTATSTPFKAAKQVIKQKTFADGKLIAVNGKPVATSKRPRAAEDAPTERPTKRLAIEPATKQNAAEGASRVSSKPKAATSTPSPVGVASRPSSGCTDAAPQQLVATATPASARKNEAVAAPKPSTPLTNGTRPAASGVEPDSKAASKEPKKPLSLNSDAPTPPKHKRGVARVIKKASKPRPVADELIDDSIAGWGSHASADDEEEQEEEEEAGSTSVSRTSRRSKEPRDTTRSLTHAAGVQKSRSTADHKRRRSRELDDETAAIIQEAIGRGLHLVGPRLTRAEARAQPTS